MRHVALIVALFALVFTAGAALAKKVLLSDFHDWRYIWAFPATASASPPTAAPASTAPCR